LDDSIGNVYKSYNKAKLKGQKDKKKNDPNDREDKKANGVLLSENNNTKRTVARIVKKAADKAGISKPVSPHVLRHTSSVNCIRKGISTGALQTSLGHDINNQRDLP